MKKLLLFMLAVLLIPTFVSAGSVFNNNRTEPSYNARNVVTKTAAYTATLSDNFSKVTTSTAGITITLPALNTLASNGYMSYSYKILKTDATQHLVTVSPSSTANTIDGTTGYVIAAQNDFIVISGSAGTTDWKVSYADDIVNTNVATGAVNIGGAFSVDSSSEVRIAKRGHTLDTGNVTLTLSDCGSIRMIATDAKTYTLPDTTTVGAGCEFTFINTGADDAVLLTVTPDDTTADAINGTCAAVVFTGTDDGDMTNTKSGANKGDWSKIVSDGVTGWFVIGCDGVWAGA